MSNTQLILTGFMGMGKTTVGSMAAETLGVPFFDTDVWMKERMELDVPALVRSDMGEFRRREREALGLIIDQEAGVIATGGGFVSTYLGRQALHAARKKGLQVVWLQADFEVAAARVAADVTGMERPLFKDVHKARTLFDGRQAYYGITASHIVDAALPARVVADQLVAIAQHELPVAM